MMFPRSFANSVWLQFRVIWALILREMHTRFGRENLGFLWFIGEPILFCGGVTIVWSAIRPSHEHGLEVPAFVITGYIPLTLWRHCVARGVKAFESNGALLYHKQVTPLDIITARVVLEVAGNITAGLIIVLITIYAGYMKPPENYNLLFIGIIYQVFFCYSFTLIIACLSEYSDLIEKFLSVVMYLSIPLSGAFTMVDWLPPIAQNIVLWSPSVQNVEMIRGGQFGSMAHAKFDLLYSSRCAIILLTIGLSLTLRVRRRLLIS